LKSELGFYLCNPRNLWIDWEWKMSSPEEKKRAGDASEREVILLPDGDLLIHNEEPGARHPYKRIYRGVTEHAGLHAKLLPLAVPGHIPPFAYADLVFLGRPDDWSEGGKKKFAKEMFAAIRKRFEELRKEVAEPGSNKSID
jgi:hypothetical protein